MKIADVKYITLLDVYGKLLTQAKQEIMYNYICCDLSLGEIAEIRCVSRQSVMDAVKTAKKELDLFEEKLCFVKKLESIKEFASTLDDVNKQKLIGLVE